MARKATATRSKNYDDYMWLGQILSIVGRQTKAEGQTKQAEELLAEAEKALRCAVEVEPKLATPWVALVQFFIAGKANDRAEKVISEASRKIPAKQAALALAQCYEAIQNTDMAQKKYEAAVAASLRTPQLCTPWRTSTVARASRRWPRTN